MSYCEYRFYSSEHALIKTYIPQLVLSSSPDRGGEFYFAEYGLPDGSFISQLNKLCLALDIHRPQEFDVYVDLKAEVICAKAVGSVINIWGYYCTLKKELSK